MNEEYLSRAVFAPGLTVCGMPPKKRLTTKDSAACWNCEGLNVARRFSGSGWYEDDLLCADCGENVASGYRPFKPRWREENKDTARQWLDEAVPPDVFAAHRTAAVNGEMGWDA
ncbi:hypothetical protein [Microbacterium sp. KNMS]